MVAMTSSPGCMLLMLMGLAAVLQHQQAFTSAQSDVRVKVEGVKVQTPKKNRVVSLRMRAVSLNKTHVIANMSMNVTSELPPQTMLDLEATPMKGGKADGAPLKTSLGTLCGKMGGKDWDDVLAKSNFPKSCPFKTGKYRLRNYVMDMSSMPPYLPRDRYRIDVSMRSDQNMMAKVSMDILITRK